MSKRILTVVLVLGTVAASNAYASRARDLVLGTGDAGVVLGDGGSSGTFYTDDAYNMFYNPAYVNDYKNWAIIEKSNFTYPGPADGNGSTAEGGFVTGIGNFTLGLFFNRQDDLQHSIYSVGQGTMRPIDVLFGGDMNDLKWGLGFTYASLTEADPSNALATKGSSDWTIHAGIEYMGFDPFVDWHVAGTDNSTASDPSNKGLEAGLRYHWGEWTPYGVYSNEQYAGNTIYRGYGVGLGRTTQATEAVKLMYAIGFFRQSQGVGLGAWNGTGTAGSRSVVPVNVAVEGDANSWLTLRAGIGYNFMDRVNDVSAADNTTGSIGATAHAGKMDFDFAVGGGNAAGAEAAGQANTQSFDFSGGLFTAASVQYHW